MESISKVTQPIAGSPASTGSIGPSSPTAARSVSSGDTLVGSSNRSAQSAVVGDVAPAAHVEPKMPAGADAKVEAAIARIAQTFTSRLVQDGESATFSAPGVAALMMFAANGTAPGSEREAYLATLGLGGLSLDEVNQAANALAHRLGHVGASVEVKIAMLASLTSTPAPTCPRRWAKAFAA